MGPDEEGIELTLEELEFVRGGFDYSGFYKYRAEILNNFKLKVKSSIYLLVKEEYPSND